MENIRIGIGVFTSVEACMVGTSRGSTAEVDGTGVWCVVSVHVGGRRTAISGRGNVNRWTKDCILITGSALDRDICVIVATNTVGIPVGHRLGIWLSSGKAWDWSSATTRFS